MAHTDAQNRNWLSSQILTKPEILVETDSIRLLVGNCPAPEVCVFFSLFNRPDCVLPLVAVCQEVTVNDTAAREADESRVHVFQHLGQVFAETVRLVLVNVRHEKRYEVYIKLSCLIRIKRNAAVVGVGGCREREFIFFPF